MNKSLISKFDALDLIDAGKLDILEKAFRDQPTLADEYFGFAGGNWLHYAASRPHMKVVAFFVALGFSVNDKGLDDTQNPLSTACEHNQVENAKFLQSMGSKIDTATTQSNPLFSAITGKAIDAVRWLLEQGIDPKIRYSNDTWSNIDAPSFALTQGEEEIASMIFKYLSNGDEREEQRLRSEAQQLVGENGPLVLQPILPPLSS